jgi:flagellar basal-body rod protein FlgB
LSAGSERKRGRKVPTVPFLDSLFGPQINNFEKAMSLTTKRHSLLVNNLANVNTPGYKRKDVDFNITLEGEQDKLGGLGDGAVHTDSGSVRLDGNSVDLESEVMSLSETELRYQALTDMTASYFSSLKNVIREGR